MDKQAGTTTLECGAQDPMTVEQVQIQGQTTRMICREAACHYYHLPLLSYPF
jgi:hypothetical protein